MKNLYNEVKQSIDLNKVLIFVVGNKNDQYEHEQVKKDIAEKYAKSINAKYRCVSALKSSGINELFDCVGRSFFIKDDNNEKGLNENESKEVYQKVFSIDPEKSSKEKNSKKKCC